MFVVTLVGHTLSMMIPTVANVLSVYRLASADDLREGLSWYLDAHALAVTLSEQHGTTVEAAAGVIAAMSPMMSWDTNKRAAIIAFQNGEANGLGLSRNVAKANAILGGTKPLDVLGGDKVRAFYNTILDPRGYSYPVIDRHAFDIAVGMVTDEKARGTLSRKGQYALFAEVYIDAAKAVGISASQMQAVTWVAWRNIKKNSAE